LWGILKEIDHLEDLDVNGSVITKWILKKSGVIRAGINLVGG
jgi:hypothetical protein